MKKGVKKTHHFFDRSYKVLFDNKVFIKALIKFSLPEKIYTKLKWSTLKAENVNFVSPDLGEREADRLYSIKMNNKKEIYVYFLIEFKSKPDKITGLMLYIYVAMIYHNLIKIGKIKKNKPEIPVIIPIVLYIGDKRWEVGESIKELIDEGVYKVFKEYIPEMRYILIDKNRYSEKELEEMRDIISGLLYLEKMGEEDIVERVKRWGEIFFKGLKRGDKRVLINYMEALVEYKYDKGADIRKERGKEEVREMFATAIEKALKKREKIGIQKGIQRGMKKGKEETAKKMLENGANIEFIKAVTGLSEEEIEKLK